MSTLNLCFEQKCEKYQIFSSESFHFLGVKFSIYLNKRVCVINDTCMASQDSDQHAHPCEDSDQPLRPRVLIESASLRH